MSQLNLDPMFPGLPYRHSLHPAGDLEVVQETFSNTICLMVKSTFDWRALIGRVTSLNKSHGLVHTVCIHCISVPEMGRKGGVYPRFLGYMK